MTFVSFEIDARNWRTIKSYTFISIAESSDLYMWDTKIYLDGTLIGWIGGCALSSLLPLFGPIHNPLWRIFEENALYSEFEDKISIIDFKFILWWYQLVSVRGYDINPLLYNLSAMFIHWDEEIVSTFQANFWRNIVFNGTGLLIIFNFSEKYFVKLFDLRSWFIFSDNTLTIW